MGRDDIGWIPPACHLAPHGRGAGTGPARTDPEYPPMPPAHPPMKQTSKPTSRQNSSSTVCLALALLVSNPLPGESVPVPPPPPERPWPAPLPAPDPVSSPDQEPTVIVVPTPPERPDWPRPGWPAPPKPSLPSESPAPSPPSSTVPAEPVPFAAAIAEAVEVHWPSLPNRLYQVRAANSPTSTVWTPVGEPVVGTGAEVRRILRRADALHRFFRVEELPGTVTNWLAGLTELDFRPARLEPQAGGLIAEGLRVNAAGISTDDFVTARFQFDEVTQSLRLLHYEVVPEVGVFSGRFFARDVGTPPVEASADGVTFTTIPIHTAVPITGPGIVLRTALEIGHVLSVALADQSREYTLEIINPSGQRILQFSGAPNTPIYSSGIPILQPGVYQIRVRPLNAATGTSMQTSVLVANSNNTALRSAAHGSPINVSLRSATHDYAKLSLDLSRGQTVRLPAPHPGIGFLVLNARSQNLAETMGLPLIFETPDDGRYFLFVYKITAGDAALTYQATLSITQP